MKMPLIAPKAALALSAVIIVCLSIPGPLRAADKAAQTPALTPEQQKFARADSECVQQIRDKKIPRSQVRTFLRGCYKERGITKYVEMPPPLPMQPVPAKTNK